MAGFGGIKKVKCAAAKPVFFCLCKKRIYSAAYSNMLSDDTLKKEFVCWYTVKLDDATTLQIDAEPISSGSSDLTYMYVVQHTTEPATLSGTFIDCAIIKQLKNAYDEA